MINKLPSEVGVTTQLVLPPKQGWKANTLYLVQVALHRHNPIHEAIFFSGRLDDNQQPFSYNPVWHPHYQSEYKLKHIFLLKVEKELGGLKV